MPIQNQVVLKHVLNTCAFAVCACGFTGCQTVGQEQQVHETAKVRTQILNLQTQVERLSSRLDGVQAERDQTRSQMGTMQRALNENTQVLDQRITAIEANMDTLVQRQQADKRETQETLSKQMARIFREQSAPASATISDEGYQHPVQAGQTLSEIAAAYGVTRQVIIKANNLKNPDLLRVGQVLFIPE